jgi:integrase
MKLTDKLVRDLPAPATGNKITYDDTVPGFGARVTAAGMRSFVLNYRNKQGRERRLTIGSPPTWDVSQARTEATALRRAIDCGEDPLADRTTLREAPSVRDLVKKFESEYLPKLRPSTIREYRALINNEILPALGNLKIASVTHTDVDRLHRQLSAHAPYRANRLAALLSRIFNLAIRWQWRLDNPVKGLERNLEEKRERCLSPSELGRFLDALNAYTNPLAADAMRLFLFTGARKSEVLGARWDQFDLDAGVWIKPSSHTKQKKPHRVPLNEPALVLLWALKRENPQYIYYTITHYRLALCRSAQAMGCNPPRRWPD